MFAILRRELSAYFTSPIGYIYLAVFYVFSGFYFFATSLMGNSASLNGVFQSLITIVVFLIPVLTMRLVSEDKRNKTDQALLTAPIGLTAIAFGKFLAALMVYTMGISITLVYGLVIAGFTPPEWPVIFGNFIGLFLVGAALISIGMFISALTENQVIAAVGGFSVALAMLLVDSLSSIVSVKLISDILVNISFFNRYSSFTMGVFDISSIFFFVSVCTIFVFLTVRTFEKKRWS